MSEIRIPTLAIAGEGGTESPPRMARLITETVDNGRLVIIEGVKHNMSNVVPELIAKEIATHV